MLFKECSTVSHAHDVSEKKIKASAKGGRTEERFSCSTEDAACKMWYNVCSTTEAKMQDLHFL